MKKPKENPNFISGEKYMLDREYNNRGIVIVLKAFTFFAKVKDPNDNRSWWTMCGRLSPLEEGEKDE